MSPGDNIISATGKDAGGNKTEAVKATISYYPLIQVTDSASREVNPRLVMDGSKVYAVWADIDAGVIYFARSGDGGINWEAEKIIGNGYNARIAKDGDSTLYVVMGGDKLYSPRRSTNIVSFTRSADGGNGFSAPLEIAEGYNPDIAVSQHGEAVYLVWHVLSAPQLICNFVKSTDGGASFSEPKLVSDTSAAHAQYPRIMTDADGSYVWVTYLRQFTEGGVWRDKTIFTRSSDYGDTFEEAIQIAEELHNSINPGMVLRQDGSLCVVWEQDHYHNHHIYLRWSYDLGRTFQPAPQRLHFENDKIDDGDYHTTDYATPALASDNLNNLYLAFVDTTGYPDDLGDIYFDTSSAGEPEFGVDLRLDASINSSSQQNPSIAANGDGDTICVMWQDDRNGNSDIYCRIIKKGVSQ